MRIALLSLLALAFAGGCTNSQTRLQLTGDPAGPTVYKLQETLWRPSANGIEVVGYGMLPFYNSPNSIGYQPRWPVSGSVTYWMHGRVHDNGAIQLTLLGPSKELGPGDDEVLTGSGQGATIDTVDEKTRRVEFTNMPIKSRNRPSIKFTLSGTIIAQSAPEKKFDQQVREVQHEQEYRRQPRK